MHVGFVKDWNSCEKSGGSPAEHRRSVAGVDGCGSKGRGEEDWYGSCRRRGRGRDTGLRTRVLSCESKIFAVRAGLMRTWVSCVGL